VASDATSREEAATIIPGPITERLAKVAERFVAVKTP